MARIVRLHAAATGGHHVDDVRVLRTDRRGPDGRALESEALGAFMGRDTRRARVRLARGRSMAEGDRDRPPRHHYRGAGGDRLGLDRATWPGSVGVLQLYVAGEPVSL